MEITAILLSRALGFVETADLRPREGLFFPDVAKELVQHCNFQKFPRTFEEGPGSDDGAQFFAGKWNKVVIEKLVFYNDGLLVDTRSGTAESKRIIEELLVWAREKLRTIAGPEIVREWAYVSNLTFRSDVPLLVTGPIERLAKSITTEISKDTRRETVYEPTGFNIAHDQLLRKHARASFTLQRRAGIPLSDNRYYSEAPLPTETHIALLEQYERDVAEMLNPRLLAARS
jgi:hypothetical protein